MIEFQNLKNVIPWPLHFGTGISTIKIAAKFEILSLYNRRWWRTTGLSIKWKSRKICTNWNHFHRISLWNSWSSGALFFCNERLMFYKVGNLLSSKWLLLQWTKSPVFSIPRDWIGKSRGILYNIWGLSSASLFPLTPPKSCVFLLKNSKVFRKVPFLSKKLKLFRNFPIFCPKIMHFFKNPIPQIPHHTFRGIVRRTCTVIH